MLEASVILELKKLSDGLTLLYVEDNDGLREKAFMMLKKIFVDVVAAADGAEGYSLFKEHQPEIVVTDISMPKIDGLEMISMIKKTAPSTKFIITSAFDDKEYLFKAIEAGVFSYMKKPVKVDELADVLIKCIRSIRAESNSSILSNYMDDVVNYQSDILALMYKDEFLFVNQMFLEFFDVDNLDKFYTKCKKFGPLLLEHKGFLYDHDDIEWFSESIKEVDKLSHVKIADKNGVNKHFILKVHPLPNKDNTYIMSLNDITNLNLLSIFDAKAVDDEEKAKQHTTIVNLLEVVHKNNSEVKLHNHYKGLTVTNPGVIESVDSEQTIIKTSFMQQKSAQYQNLIYITSKLLPSPVLCTPIKKIDFDQQIISFNKMHFVPNNPMQRKDVRVSPEDVHTVSLFLDERKFYADIVIYDISIEATKLEMRSLPAGLKVGTEVLLDIVLEDARKPIIVNTPAEVFRIDEMNRTFLVVMKFDLTSENKKLLVEYIAKRQMNLIHEFKSVQFG